MADNLDIESEGDGKITSLSKENPAEINKKIPEIIRYPKLRNELMIIGSMFAVMLTFIFRMTGLAYNYSTGEFVTIKGALDLQITGAFYQDGEWILQDNPFIVALNEYDWLYLGILALISFIMILYGFRDNQKRSQKTNLVALWVVYYYFCFDCGRIICQ